MSENLNLIDPDNFRRSGYIPAFPTIAPDNSPGLRSYWRVVVKRRWSIAMVSVVLLTLTAIVSFKMHPVYRAVARVEIEEEAPPLQNLNDLYRITPGDLAYLATQVDVLESDNLAWKTIEELRLGENPEFSRDAKPSKDAPDGALESSRNRLLQVFRKRLNVHVLDNSRMVEVSFEARDAALAAQVVNALLSGYMEYSFRKRYDSTRRASEWMQQQLDELKARVENSQQAMVDYERKNALVSLGDKETIAEQKLADLNREFTQAQSDRMKKESLYQLVDSNDPQAATVTQNDLLERLGEKYAELQSQYVEALERYGPQFPRVTRLRDQANEIQGLIDREKTRVAEAIRGDYKAALARENLLAAAVSRQKVEVGAFNQLLIQDNLLKRDFESNQQLYESLLQHLNDATVSAGMKSTNLHVVDSAAPPAVPVRPKKLLNLAVALALGLILGVILAFTEEALDNSVSSIEELESLLGAPTLAVVPNARPRASLSRGQRQNGSKGAVTLFALKEPGSPQAESFRNLRTAILLSTAPRPPQIILVTSTQAFEGKTWTSLNLALSLAQRGARTLMIDADLRKQGISRALGVKGLRGLSGILTGAHTFEESAQPIEGVSGLVVLPAGPRPPNPAELLSSASMEKLLRDLCQRFDHVVLDSPPLLPVTDATVLSTFADGVVLVVESGVTDRAALSRAQRVLGSARARFLGTVLNKFDPSHDGYYGSSYRAYFESDSKNNGAGAHLESGRTDAPRPPREISL